MMCIVTRHCMQRRAGGNLLTPTAQPPTGFLRPSGASFTPNERSRSMSRSYGIPLLGVLAAIAIPCASHAAITQQFFLSDTNKLYYVIASDPTTGSFGAQVTSILMTSGTALPINETSDNPPDPVVTSFGTGLTGGILRFPPLSNIQRTELLTGLTSNNIENMGNPLNGVFDPHANNGDGLLTLPGGAGTVAFSGGG